MSLISVVVPIYNVEPYLRRCVDSILAQTYGDLEVILVDDGSPDNCGAICDEYAARDSRVKVIHQQNAGVSAARNAGMAVAQGEYLAFVDSDDYIDDTMYERLLEVAEQTDADVVECNWQTSGCRVTRTGEVFVRTGLQALESLIARKEEPDSFFVCPFNKLIRAKLAKNLCFFEGCTIAEDMLYAVQLMHYVKIAVKLDVCLYHYCLSENSATRSEYSVCRCDEVDAYGKMVDFMSDRGQPKLKQIVVQKYLMRILMHWMECYSRKEQEVYRQQAKVLHVRFCQDYPTLRNNISLKERVKFGFFMRYPVLFYPMFAAYLRRRGFTRYAY